jgi:capsular polysaccharide transport system permease protein
LYFVTGVIFPVHLLPQEYLDWLLWNPMLHLIELSRHSFMPQYRPLDGVNLLYPLGCTLLFLTIGLAQYRIKRLRLIASS